MRRFFPHPFLSGAIVFMWLILNDFTLGQLLLGSVVSLFGSWMIQLLEPEKVTVKSWSAVFRLFFRVLIDSICANVMMAWFILTKKRKEQHSGFIVVPLALKSRTALAVLACIFSAIPGTVWIAYNSKNSELLVHVLNLTDGNDYQQLIKQRYEQLLLEIF